MEINRYLVKRLFAILMLPLAFLIVFPTTVLAATNYGDGNYGGGNYNVGDTPAPTSAPTNNNSSSTSSSPVSAPTCGDSATTGIPDLFEIRTTKNTATLFFAPPRMPYSNFYIAFSRRMDIWEYGTQYNQGYSGGVLSYTIYSLQPNTKYYFEIRSGNGCATGAWGNMMIATTTSAGQTRAYYKNAATAIVQQTKAVINNIVSPIKELINNLIPAQKTTTTPAPKTFTQTQTQTQPQTSVQPNPKPKFCILWWCF